MDLGWLLLYYLRLLGVWWFELRVGMVSGLEIWLCGFLVCLFCWFWACYLFVVVCSFGVGLRCGCMFAYCVVLIVLCCVDFVCVVFV